MTLDYLKIAAHQARKHARRKVQSDGSPEHQIAERSLDVATALCPVDPCERSRMNAEEHEDCGAGELDRRTRGEP